MMKHAARRCAALLVLLAFSGDLQSPIRSLRIIPLHAHDMLLRNSSLISLFRLGSGAGSPAPPLVHPANPVPISSSYVPTGKLSAGLAPFGQPITVRDGPLVHTSRENAKMPQFTQYDLEHDSRSRRSLSMQLIEHSKANLQIPTSTSYDPSPLVAPPARHTSVLGLGSYLVVAPIANVSHLTANSSPAGARKGDSSTNSPRVAATHLAFRVRQLMQLLTGICALSSTFIICHMMPTPGGQPSQDGTSYRVPPRWSPEIERSYSFRNYMNDLVLWIMLTDLQPHQQAAAIILRLGGTAREMSRTLTPLELT